MSLVKAKLKAAREAIGKKQFAAAKDAAEQALAFDPVNYNANVFLGLALLELGDLSESEQAYRRAIDASAEQPLAWQGILKFYERTDRWDQYRETARHLLDLFAQLNDAPKCVETLDKLIECSRMRGTHAQLVEALTLLLPDSPVYGVLSTLPIPDHTNPDGTPGYATQVAVHNTLPVLQEIVTIVETAEDDAFSKEVAKRRTRLGAASPEQLRKEVGVEIWGPSPLPKFYDDILNHPNTPDDLRRATDAKLLRYKHRYLKALPPGGDAKLKVSREVDELVAGAITLGLPDELAWMLFFDGQDCTEMENFSLPLLRQFIELFPSLPLTSLLRAYFQYKNILLVEADDDDEETPVPAPETGDPFDAILDVYPAISDFIIVNQIVVSVYLHECDYQNCLTVAENGLSLVGRAEADRGKYFPRIRLGFKVALATSLVHLFPPKHHVRALSVIDEVLSQAPDNTLALMGRAYVLQEDRRWEDAIELFARVNDLLPGDLQVGIRAREELAWCQSQSGSLEAGIQGLEDVLTELADLEDTNAECARCLWRIGKSYWDLGDEKRDEAYRYFIQSLKRNPSYAPAFTSLGIYYSEFVTPRDPTRASKCFQKAFELDAREAVAARRLADGFAEEREWDLVEVVARRTIEGEGGLDAGLKVEGSVGRFLPTNAWAWKAVGVVELARANYAPAIQALQITLRAEPDDQVSWLRLGEAYSRAGRHAAAIKALARAKELDPDDWMCTFFLGDVQRQIGQFQEAVDAFQSILAHRPSEVGVLVSLGQTYLDLGKAEFADGFVARSEQSFITAVRVALQTMGESAGFRTLSWKTAADAIFFLSRRSTCIDEEGVRAVLLNVVTLLPPEPSGRLAGLISVPLFTENSAVNGLKALEIAASAYDCRIALGPSESLARGSAWHDLGMSLQCLALKQASDEKRQSFIAKAGECLAEAVREDPGNEFYWVALGNAKVLLPKTAQHAYIKAIEIDSKNALTWTNLGLLYLHETDLELANQALFRAQTLDPECTTAWLGQALVATANGHETDSTTLIEHAVTLASAVPEADLEYATRTFARLTSKSLMPSVDNLLPVFFVLDRYCRGRPDDACALHLFGLVCESLGQAEFAVELIGRAIAILEAEYEETEAATVERQFIIANSNMARLRLSLKDYEGAIESFESALGLLAEDGKDDVMRAHAQFGMGLSNFKLGNLEAALSLFEAALESAGDNTVVRGHVTVLLAQTLWAIGSEESKESAKAQLLDCISTDPENLAAINALAGMGILTEDDALVDAALAEVLALPLDRRLELDPHGDVNYLLTKHHIGQDNAEAAISVAQNAVFVDPGRRDARNELATLNIQTGMVTGASALLSVSSIDSESIDTARASLALQAITASLTGDRDASKRYAQKAVFLSPGQTHNWQTLAYVGTY